MMRLSRSVARAIVLASIASALLVLTVLWLLLEDARLFWIAALALLFGELVAGMLILRLARDGAGLRSRPLVGRPVQPVVPFHRSRDELVGQVLVDGELWSAVLLGEREAPDAPLIVSGFEGQRLIVRRAERSGP